MSKEAMKLALEALEANQPVNYCMNNNGEKFPMMQEDPFRFERNSKAITVLREALAEQPAQQVVDSNEKAGAYMEARLWEFIDMAAAWPKASPDPRTWDHVVVYAPKPAQQEPVALPEKTYEFVPTPEPAKWHHPECEGECIACLIERVVQEAYGSQGLGYLQRHLTSPPARRTWVGLTDEAIWLEYQRFWPFHPAEEPTLAKDIAKFARAIEAKLREKNA